MELEYSNRNSRRSKIYIAVGVVIALLVAATVFIALQASGLTEDTTVEQRQVVVAVRDIPARKAVEEGDVVVRTVAADPTNETAFTSLDQVLGRVVGIPVATGQLMTRNVLASETEGQGMFSIQQPCSKCGGTGTEIKDPCPTCQGTGRTRQIKKYRVNIPAGVKDGSRIRLPGKGEAGLRGGPPGDLFVVTRVDESPIFKRKGENFEVEVPITVAEAIRGADVEVPTLHGTKKLRVPGGTKHGTVQRLRGEGPPALGARGRGDIHYRFVIDVPKDLSPEQVEALEGFSNVMNGNPRADLLRHAKKAAST